MNHLLPLSLAAIFTTNLATNLATTLATAGDIRVLVWDEQQPQQKQGYGEKFLGETIAAHLAKQAGVVVKNTNLEAPEQGVDEATLDATDVIIWWGHVRHAQLTNANAERVAQRVREGRLSLIALHSAHWANPSSASCKTAQRPTPSSSSPKPNAPPPSGNSPTTPRLEKA